ncbi:MAG: rhamnogalacturonan acetylesterase [Ignavibacteriales bacterium]|nr:MAG: rhamnogalacturonan acetylesterase [Ignavibacteriales bacterium]
MKNINYINTVRSFTKSIRQKNILVNLLYGVCFFFILGFTPEDTIRIFLIGDSTMANKPIVDNPEHGWGQMFPDFFNEGVQIFNHAKNGRSTKNFISQGRWNVVFNQLKPGDYVFIQFGHNDAKKDDTLRFALPRPDYKNNLKKFIREARQKQAIPVLLTSITRRDFDKDGRLKATHGEYPEVMKEVAMEENVPLIDMFEKTKNIISQLGDEESKQFYLAGVKQNEFRHWNGKKDDTHFTRVGAIKMASLVAEGIRELKLPLADKLIKQQFPDLIGRGKVVGLDYALNDDRRYKKDSSRIFRHYAWEDSSESGFAHLGNIIDRLGADLDTLQQLPTESFLNRLSIFIVVNPAKHKSDRHSNEYVEAVEKINSWVKKGGILILMDNDGGKSDCTFFTSLAKNFGIEFIRNDFKKKKTSETIAGENLHQHKIFNGVNQLIATNVSTLRISEQYESILENNGKLVMASVNVGEGLVLAISNSWLLNKYTALHQLYSGNGNIKAAKNLFTWLLTDSKLPLNK